MMVKAMRVAAVGRIVSEHDTLTWRAKANYSDMIHLGMDAPPAVARAMSRILLILNLEKRSAKGINFIFCDTGMSLRDAEFFLYEGDRTPTERASNDRWPHRIVVTMIDELPFGKGKWLMGGTGRAMNMVVGGWQVAATS